ncbi:hypothetical protein VHUM_02161 [Vanrija humicola]|uniref:Sugar phosphate transporter domain-containing protein n=1 Tax=Vanrija humicola TaxID=5417 RepID=A0A7D8YZW8_VANHU|nr:hypothetical protein VHUM_02161 [Vanrija humicola]
MSGAAEERTTHSASVSPPESPIPLTPAQFSPPLVTQMTTANGHHGGEPSAYVGDQTDAAPQPPHRKSASVNYPQRPPLDPHPRADYTTSTFTTSSLSTAQPEGYRERAHHPQRPSIQTGFIPGSPPKASPKKEPPPNYQEAAAWNRAYPNGELPLSGANGSAAYGSEPSTSNTEAAANKFTNSTPYWLGMYFFFNLGLTLFNKVVLVSFPFPYTLTGLHALSGCAGCYIALERGAFTPARLTQHENLILAAFSVLYTINIAVSNISLQLVTVPFHQVVRAATPLFTIFISAAILRQKFSINKLVSLLPVVAGVGFATYGDYYFTAMGLILTLLGTLLAALKTVVTNLIQTGGGGRLKLHPLDLLMRMSPLAFIQCVFYGWWTGELERVRRYGATQMTRTKAVALLINGIIACGLNIVSFTANKKAGALTMTVSANCKQVLTIALAVVLFNLEISVTNGIGILLTLIGGAWYAFVEFSEKSKKTAKAAPPSKSLA